MDRKKFHVRAVEHLKKQSWINEEDIEELDASISHWCQTPYTDLPFFKREMRRECLSLLRAKFLDSKKEPCFTKEKADIHQEDLRFLLRMFLFLHLKNGILHLLIFLLGSVVFDWLFKKQVVNVFSQVNGTSMQRKHMKQILVNIPMGISGL